VAVGELGRRVAVAAVGIPAGVGIIYLGGWTLAGVLSLLGLLGTREVYSLASARGWRPFPWLGVPAALFLILAAARFGSIQPWAPWAIGILTVLTLGSLAASVFRRGPGGDPLLAAGTTVLGTAYAALPLAFAIFLREFAPGGVVPGRWEGAYLLMFPLVVTWMGDTSAYFTGKHLGRRKLLPSVSPKKTMAGGVGGLVGAVAGSVLFTALFLNAAGELTLPLGWAAVVGLLVGIVAQVGDLTESVLKREAGVKDSGSILPGHGGVLDRFDAVFFTVPLTYAVLPLVLS
jgi:phosphatidate cytidylyltransferase